MSLRQTGLPLAAGLKEAEARLVDGHVTEDGVGLADSRLGRGGGDAALLVSDRHLDGVDTGRRVGMFELSNILCRNWNNRFTFLLRCPS